MPDSHFVHNQEPAAAPTGLDWVQSLMLSPASFTEGGNGQVQTSGNVNPDELYEESVTETQTFEIPDDPNTPAYCKLTNEEPMETSTSVREETTTTKKGPAAAASPVAKAVHYLKSMDKNRWKEYAVVAGLTLLARKIIF